MGVSLSILFVEDSEEDALLTLRVLARGGYDVTWERVWTAQAMSEALDRREWDLVISGYVMDGFGGMDALSMLRERDPDLPFIVVSGAIGEDTAVAAMKAGAHDYIMKDNPARLVPAVERELREAGWRRERRAALVMLRESEERYRSLIDNMSDVVVRVGLDRIISYVSPRVWDLSGVKPHQVIGRPYYEVVAPESVPRIEEQFRLLLAGQSETFHDVLVIHDDEHLVPVEASVMPLYGADGALTGVQAILRDVSERRRAERELSAAHHRLQNIIEFLPDATFVIDDRGRVIAWNRAIEEMTGVRKEEIVGKGDHAYATPFYGHPHPILIDHIGGDLADMNGHYDHVQREGDALYAEMFIPSIYGGRGGYVWSIASPLYNESGSRVGAIESVRDITARKLAERALRESEARFRDLAERSFDIIFSTDAEGRITYVSPSIERIGGYSADDTIGRLWTAYLAVPHDEVIGHILERLACGETVEGLLLPVRRRGGGVAYVEFNVSPIMQNGIVVGAQGIGRDVTERRVAEEALRESEQRFRDLFDGIPACCYTFDADGTILDWNRACAAVYGWTAQEAVGRPVYELIVTERYAEAMRDSVAAVFRGGSFEGLELEAVRADGETCYVLVNHYPLRDAHGEVLMGMSAGLDISAHKRLTDQLRQSQKMDAIGQLAGGIAHDFNNLLTVINGYSQFMVRSLDHTDPLHQDAKEILAAGERAASMTRQLLAFSRRQVLEMRVLDLNEVIEGVSKMLPRLIGEHISLDVRLAPDLGYVRADPGQIEQVIINLVVNARDAMPEGGELVLETANVARIGETRPDLGPPRDHGCVKLSVQDTGCGMSPEVLEHLFEPFFTTKEAGAGTGLGLSTVYGIVKQSGGEVVVDSAVEVGSTFAIYLPRASEAGEPLEADVVDGVPQGSETVLLVEDQEEVRRLTGRMLRELGYHVIEADRGQPALELLRDGDKSIDLVVTDVVMPEMDGRSFVEALRAERSGFEVLYMSGYSEDELLRRGVRDADAPFVHKPFTAADLGRKVRAALDSRGAR